MATSLSLFDLKPGKLLLDRYQIQRRFREGGIFGAFEVQDTLDQSRKELQVFHAGLFEGKPQATQFAERLEAWQAARIDGIAQAEGGAVLDDGSVILIREFPRGMSLRQWLAENTRMDQGTAVALANDLLQALTEAHAQGLIHGDIKPATIYVEPGESGGQLVDAGITPAMWAAKHLGTRTALIGTPYYAPIEQFTGDSPDELSDLYNLSTVLYEALTGVMPWSGKGYIEVFQSKMEPAPPAMAERAPEVEVAPELEQVIATGLRAKRQERHVDAATYLERLRAVSPARA